MQCIELKLNGFDAARLVFHHDEFSDAAPVVRGVLLLIGSVAVQKPDDVGGHLDGAGVLQNPHHRSTVASILGTTVEFR